ncbi:MAG: hypothetical protein ACJ796_22090 [Gemmatimonadaceae bacterium]
MRLTPSALTLALACAIQSTDAKIPAPCAISQVDTAGWVDFTPADYRFRMRLPAGAKEVAVHCFDTACGKIVTAWGDLDWSLEYGSHPIDSLRLGADAIGVQQCEDEFQGRRALLVTGQYSRSGRAPRGHYFAFAGFPRGNTMMEFMTESASPDGLLQFLAAARTAQFP